MSPVAALPSLSQLLAWPTGHLTEAADYWETVGARSYAVAQQVWRDAIAVDWQGDAAQALRTVTREDMTATSAVADRLQAAAKVARSGASDLYAVSSRMRYAVEDAHAAGFDVGEDLSVAYFATGGSAAQRAALRAEAEAVADDVRQRAARLVALDRQVAGRITAAVAGIRHTFPGNPTRGKSPEPRIQAVDHHTFQQDPPPQPAPYPMNDVVAEATDLDGNHVVLRRGYYNASTDKGFGWDKAYWKHGVVNPNVFKDLISHGRPVRLPDGTLRYDLPINRVHCTSGLLGIADCQDTGESLTMRIVVDPRVERVDVPDGGQKGVITMFPLPGGSGVVEVNPEWTLTPPWVNHNVPIN